MMRFLVGCGIGRSFFVIAAVHIRHWTRVSLIQGMAIANRSFTLCRGAGKYGLHAANHARRGGHPERKCEGEERIECAPREHLSARTDYIASRRPLANVLGRRA